MDREAVGAAVGAERAQRRPGGLLFDRVEPQRYSAQDFAYRSGWPATGVSQPGGEIILYQERFYDREGGPWWTNQWTYRRFDTRRYGVAYR